MNIAIPTFEEAEAAHEAGQATPLDMFVYSNEPAGDDDEKEFREGLRAMIEFIVNEVRAK